MWHCWVNSLHMGWVSFCKSQSWHTATFCLFVPVPFLHWKRASYFLDYSNVSDWFSALLSLLFVVPLMLNVEGTFHWQAGAIAGLHCWMGFLLYMQRFLPPENWGISSAPVGCWLTLCFYFCVCFKGLKVLEFMLWCLWKSWERCSGSCCSSSTWCLPSVWLSTLLCWIR